jgi:CelD/BcsL family acetyltransferase involved in cellulose biosynthesis
VNIEIVVPWETPGWDEYVRAHPGSTVYHTSDWIRTVCDVGSYPPLCLVVRDGPHIHGLLPIAEVRSRLTGDRMTTLPFSDACGVLAENSAAADTLLDGARRLRDERGLGMYEMRMLPVLRTGDHIDTPAGFSCQGHFFNYVIPLGPDPDAVRKTFARKSVRQTINKSARLGVTVRRGQGEEDLRTFYRLYALNRRRHGIPPQPLRLFRMIFERLGVNGDALLYFSEYEGRAIAALIVLRCNGVVYAKYEGIDESRRDVLPLYPLFWRSIEDACHAGDTAYDLGRTSGDNEGLMEFKSRWGTERTPLPYYFYPPGEGVSTVRRDSLKYRLFTGVFRRLPLSASTWLGTRIFRHFG